MAEITQYQSPHVHMHKEQYGVMIGNASNGFLFYGPFDDTGDILDFVDKVRQHDENTSDNDWHIFNLWQPKLSEKP